MIYKMSTSEEYTDGYGKIEDIGSINYQYGSQEYNFYHDINKEIKKIENGYFIKCLYTSTSSNSHSSNYVLLIDNYGNYTNYSITNVNANSSNFGTYIKFPLSLNIKNKNYKLSNKLIDLVKSIKVQTRYNFDNGEQKSFNEYELYINDFLSNIQILAEDNYKKYIENIIIKLNKQPDEKNEKLEERINQQNELISKLMDEIYDLKNKN